MPQYRVLKRSTKERIYVDKINPSEHLHITGVEFTSSMMKDMQANNEPNMFKKEEEVVKKVEVVEEVVEAPKKVHWKTAQKAANAKK